MHTDLHNKNTVPKQFYSEWCHRKQDKGHSDEEYTVVNSVVRYTTQMQTINIHYTVSTILLIVIIITIDDF